MRSRNNTGEFHCVPVLLSAALFVWLFRPLSRALHLAHISQKHCYRCAVIDYVVSRTPYTTVLTTIVRPTFAALHKKPLADCRWLEQVKLKYSDYNCRLCIFIVLTTETKTNHSGHDKA